MTPALFLYARFGCRLTPRACIARQEALRHRPRGHEVCSWEFCSRCPQGLAARSALEQAGQLSAALAEIEQARKANGARVQGNMRARWKGKWRDKSRPALDGDLEGEPA